MPVLPRTDLYALAADAQRFASSFPAGAGRLGRQTSDAATERIVEGNYFLAGTLLDKVDDFQSSGYEAVAQRACPWLRRPLPSSTVMAFDAPETESVAVPDDLVVAAESGDVPSGWRLVAPCTLRPYRIASATLEAPPGRPATIRIRIEATGESPVNHQVGAGLSLFLGGDLEAALATVHAITSSVEPIEVSSAEWSTPIRIERPRVTRGGLRADESIAPDPDGPAPAFGVVTEAFVAPERFRMLRIEGLEACGSAKPTSNVTLCLTLREPPSVRGGYELDVQAHCAVVTNLFEAMSEPIALDLERGPVPIRVARPSAEAGVVYAVREAWATAAQGAGGPIPLLDLRRLSAARAPANTPAAFAVSLAVHGGAPIMNVAFSPASDASRLDRHIVSMRLLATNGARVAGRPPRAIQGVATIAGDRVAFGNVVQCSPYVPPPLGGDFARRALRHGALRLGSRGLVESLRDALFLAVPSCAGGETTRAMHLRVEAVRAVEADVARHVGPTGAVRHGYGYRVTVDESAFRGPGDLGLFGAALGEALSRSVAVNTFARLTLIGAKGNFRAVYPNRTL